MTFKLRCCLGDEEQTIDNPTQEHLENALSLLCDEGDYFIVLEPEHPIEDCPFMQCIMSDEDYLIQIRSENLNNPRIYQFCTKKINDAVQLFMLYLSGKIPNLSYWEDIGGAEKEELIEESELCHLLQSKGLIALKCVTAPKGNEIILNTSSLNTIIDYTKRRKFEHIFYRYKFGDENIFSLRSSNLHIDRDLSLLANNDIIAYNEQIKGMNFNKPAFLELFCLDHGVLITAKVIAPWFEALITANEFMAQLREKYAYDLNRIKENRALQRESILEELKPILLEDAEFVLCTNQNLRRDFMRRFLVKSANKRFQAPFLDSTGYIDNEAVSRFADLVYALYKQSKKR